MLDKTVLPMQERYLNSFNFARALVPSLGAEQERLMDEELAQLGTTPKKMFRPAQNPPQQNMVQINIPMKKIPHAQKNPNQQLSHVHSCSQLLQTPPQEAEVEWIPRPSERVPTSYKSRRIRHLSAGTTRRPRPTSRSGSPHPLTDSPNKSRPTSRHKSLSEEADKEVPINRVEYRRGLSANRSRWHNPEDDGFSPIDDSTAPPFRIEVTSYRTTAADGNWVRNVKSAERLSGKLAAKRRTSYSAAEATGAKVQWPHHTIADDTFSFELDGFETITFEEEKELNWCGTSPVAFETPPAILSGSALSEKYNAQDLQVDEFNCDHFEDEEGLFTTTLGEDFLSLFAPS